MLLLLSLLPSLSLGPSSFADFFCCRWSLLFVLPPLLVAPLLLPLPLGLLLAAATSPNGGLGRLASRGRVFHVAVGFRYGNPGRRAVCFVRAMLGREVR